MIFVVKPARIRQGHFVSGSDASEEVDWQAFSKRFLPTGSSAGRLLLSRVVSGSFVGLVRKGSKDSLFVMEVAGTSRSLESVVKRNPDFEKNVKDVCFVERVVKDAKIED